MNPAQRSSGAPLRVGIVGLGFGATVHLPAYHAQGRFDVVAIASPRRAGQIARERNVPNAFDSIEAMLEGVELDVVSVASPPFAHRDAVLASLSHHKHVLCEKPFGLNVAQCEEMVAAAERAGTVCAIAHEFRYVPARIAIKELLDNGHLGALREIEVTIFATWLRAAEQGRRPGWWFERRFGGGITGAYLSHLIDQASWLAGRHPIGACGFERTANPERRFEGKAFRSDVADGAFALIDYGDGLIAHVAADATRAVGSSLLAVHGELRTAVASGKGLLDVTTFVVDDSETAELEIAPDRHAKLQAAHPSLPPFIALLDDFAAAIDGRPTTIPTFADGLATQRVLAAVGYG